MTFLHGSALTTAITAIVKDGKADLAVAFWGGEAVDRLGLPQDCSNIRIACDAYSGACNPKAFEDLLARNARIVDVPGLHAKVYNNHAAMIVTSANASTNGLTESAADIPGDEAGVHVTDDISVGAATAWFETIWQGRTAITKDDLPALQKLWNQQRNNRPIRSNKTLSTLILENSPLLQDRKLLVYAYRSENPPTSVQSDFASSAFFVSDIVKTSYGRAAHPYFWGDLPVSHPGDEIICLEKARSVTFEGVWKIIHGFKGSEYMITPCTEIVKPLGLDLGPKSEWDEIGKSVNRLMKDNPVKISSELIMIDNFSTMIQNYLK